MPRVTVDNRKDCVLYCKYLQEEDFIKKDIRGEVIQCFTINLRNESDSSSNEIENET